MKLKPLVLAAAVALTSLSSYAADTDWAAHGALEGSGLVFPTTTPFPLFLDKYSFTLSATSLVTSSVASANITPGVYSIFNADDTLTSFSWSFGGAPVNHTATLGAGSYYYAVFGQASSGAVYSLASTATAVPVPEPETYAMLLAGLGVVGFVARRRRAD